MDSTLINPSRNNIPSFGTLTSDDIADVRRAQLGVIVKPWKPVIPGAVTGRVREPLAQHGNAAMIRGEDFLKCAERSAIGPTETDWRTGVSRAYYVAFHEARDCLTALGFQTPRADMAHAFLWRRLQNCGHVRLALAGSRLNQLRGERNQADVR